MPELQRITTEYIDTEDRLRLTGEVAEGESAVLWLTQRLLTRLVPHLVLWLEQQNGKSLPTEIAQSFAQQAARAELAPQPPVQRFTETADWLVQAVDITPDNGAMRMRFRGTRGEEATLTLPVLQLRQWLEIVNSMWAKGEWTKGVWPEWMGQEPPESGKRRISVH